MRRPEFDPTMAEVVRLLGNLPDAEISRRTGIATSTLRNWRYRRTRRPQHLTLEFALKAQGYGFVIRKVPKA